LAVEGIMKNQNPPKRITLTQENLHNWPNFQRLFEEGKVIFDKTGRLRYPHGAPVGEMVLVMVGKDGQPIYKESGEEWFDPDSPMAKRFKWP
jgi:hypothetical protein